MSIYRCAICQRHVDDDFEVGEEYGDLEFICESCAVEQEDEPVYPEDDTERNREVDDENR